MKTDLQISHGFTTHRSEETKNCDDCKDIIAEYKEAIQNREIVKFLSLA